MDSAKNDWREENRPTPPFICLARHCETTATAPKQARRFLGQGDPPLSQTGIAQAQELAARLRALNFGRVYASPLIRARHTAAIITGGADIITVQAFAEINLGAWEGLTVAETQARFPGQYERRGADIAHFRPEGGESFHDLAARVLPAFLRIAQEAATATKPTLIVAHAGVNRVVLAHLRGIILPDIMTIHQPHGAVTLLSNVASTSCGRGAL
ncbi:MAG: histidine phosphatase family protein [Desulfobulbaceae bacterium]|jgi:probable phosphoglycerate mutase|nr:histidine phosphatase family protein [Desulfobulbaceae bacterium]